jgi:hypothetical protein
MAGVLMIAFRSIGNIAEEKPAARCVLFAETKEMLSCHLSGAAMKRCSFSTDARELARLCLERGNAPPVATLGLALKGSGVSSVHFSAPQL